MIIPVLDNTQSVEKKKGERRVRVFSLTSTVRIDESRCRGSRIFRRRLGDPADEELVAVGRSGVEVFGRDVGRGRQRAKQGCYEAAEVRASAVDVADGQLGHIGHCGHHRRHGRLDLGIQLEGHDLLRVFLVYLDGLRSIDLAKAKSLAMVGSAVAKSVLGLGILQLRSPHSRSSGCSYGCRRRGTLVSHLAYGGGGVSRPPSTELVAPLPES